MQRFESMVHLFMWSTKRGINYKHGAVELEDVKLPFTVGIEKSRLGNGVYNMTTTNFFQTRTTNWCLWHR